MECKDVMGKLYDMTRELPPPAEYRVISKKFQDEREKLLKEIGENYRSRIEKLTDLQIDRDEELIKQAFYEGFSTATNLFVEIIGNEKRDI